ncbi:MAG: PIN domain-containing protein [Rhodanobacter sp.]|nr:MAG: PIN domain-containing protein [Rhodanobacter sp.]TAL90663.1 MAG: PIN domain-containing protein [Rhodanobacter sp.]TAM43276.1 MAG: PIN domain-containing protein [Rhodanobacter sp.]
MSLVLDNSVVMRWCFGDGKPEALDYAAKVARKLRSESALVPGIWGLEVANVLARAESRNEVTSDKSNEFLALLKNMRIEVDPSTANHALADTLDLARSHNLSAYDAAYLELALREQLPLATLDKDLRAACHAAGAMLFA